MFILSKTLLRVYEPVRSGLASASGRAVVNRTRKGLRPSGGSIWRGRELFPPQPHTSSPPFSAMNRRRANLRAVPPTVPHFLHYHFTSIDRDSPLANLALKARLNAAAASALSITIKSLSCRLRPGRGEVCGACAQQTAVDLAALEMHWRGRLVLGPDLDGRGLG
jgi:hypothetical protein